MSFQLEIVTPEKTIFTGEASQLTVPAVTGQITILSHHLPLFTPLKNGVVKYTASGRENQLEIGKGMLEVQKDKVILLVESPQSADKIAQKDALKAQEKSQKLKTQVSKPTGVIAVEDAFRRSFIDFKEVRKKRKFQPFPSSEQPG